MIKNTTIILLLVFCTTYMWLNFGFISYGLASFLGSATNTSNLESALEGKTYLFPLSQDIAKEGPKSVQNKTAAVAITISSSSMLKIPSLNIQAPIVFEPTTIEKRIYSALEKGVVHYAQTPRPGQLGTSIILGHSSSFSWYKGEFGSIFANLSKLNEGDIINIEKEGQLLSYRVARSLIFYPYASDDFALRELETTNGSSLVLMTCWPTGTNAKRIAVKADLII